MYAKILNGKCVKVVVDAPKNLEKINKLKEILKERGLGADGSHNVAFLEVDRIYFMGNFLWLVSEKPRIEIFLQGNEITIEDKYYEKEYKFNFD